MPKFFDMDAVQKRVEKAIADAYKEPDAKTLVAFTKGKHLAILGMTNALVGEVVKRTVELYDKQQALMDELLKRVEKTAQQVAAMNGRISAIERKFLAKD